MSKLSYKARAAAGAALLDEMEPGWYLKVDTETLNIGSGAWCVHGQVFGDWMDGSWKVSRHFGWNHFPEREWQSAHGFQATYEEATQSLESYDYAMKWLKRRWTAEINDRKAAA